MTIAVTAVSLGIGMILGLFLGILRIYGGRFFSPLATGYSLLIRSLPSILVVLLFYFSFSGIVNLSPFWAGSLALSISSSAYQSEIFRGAILSVPDGQLLAALSIGMSRFKAIIYIILPQIIRPMIAPWSNEATLVLKDSSLVFVLGVPEILRQAQYYSARTYEPFLAYGAAALLYFILTYTISYGLGRIEDKIKLPSQFI